MTTTPTTRPERWGANVEQRRSKISMSQSVLATKAGTSQQTISRIELGLQVPKDDLRVRIANALLVTVAELFDYEGE